MTVMILDVNETLGSTGQVRKVVTVKPEPGSPPPDADEYERRMLEALALLVGLPDGDFDDVVIDVE